MKWGENESIDRMRLRQPFNYKGTVWNTLKKSVKQRCSEPAKKKAIILAKKFF
jgi:hypothetical protein